MPRKYTHKTSIEERFWSKVAITADDNQCWLWLAGKTDNRYGHFWYNSKVDKAHRVAWMLPDYVLPDGMEVCHSCDNPSCVNPKHLFLGTHQDNVDDMNLKGRGYKFKLYQNENHSNHKLTDVQVIEIRKQYALGGISMEKLGFEYSVSASQICVIVNHKQRKTIQS